MTYNDWITALFLQLLREYLITDDDESEGEEENDCGIFIAEGS